MGSDVKYVVFTDADFTYPAENIPKMIEILERDPKVGMVIGNRFDRYLTMPRVSTSLFNLGNKVLAFLNNFLSGVSLHDPLSGFRIIRSELLKNWKPASKGFDIEIEMNHLVEKQNYEIIEIPISYRIRLGTKKLKVRDGLGITKKIITAGFK